MTCYTVCPYTMIVKILRECVKILGMREKFPLLCKYTVQH